MLFKRITLRSKNVYKFKIFTRRFLRRTNAEAFPALKLQIVPNL